MTTYKLDISKKLPYPSFLGLVLKEGGVLTFDPLLTKPNSRSGLDNGAVSKMHYYQDSGAEWFYSDGDNWFYDYIVVSAHTERDLVLELRANRNNEDVGLNDVEMGEAENDSDPDDEPGYEGHQQGVGAQGSDLSQSAY